MKKTSFMQRAKLTVQRKLPEHSGQRANSGNYGNTKAVRMKFTNVIFIKMTKIFHFPMDNCPRLYAVGGRDGSSCLKSMECFDPHTNKWSLCAPMSKRRGGVGVATYNGFLYAVGGHDAPASNHCSRLSDCVER